MMREDREPFTFV